MARENLLSLFNDFLRWGGDAAVVQRRGYRREKVTYAELHANALRGRGVQRGDRVLLWGPNSAEWMSCFWAILLHGAVVVPMDSGASADFVRRVVKDAGVKLILRDLQQAELADLPPSLVINDFREVVARPEAPPDAAADSGDLAKRSDIAEILYTSGTTAEPRGVVLTHGNFLANLEPLEQGIAPYRKYERWMHPLRFVSLVPLSHVFGQFMMLFVPPLLGATVVFEPSANASEIIRTIKKERATAVIAVPRMLDALRAGLQREIDARGWRGWFERAYRLAAGEKFLRRAWRFRRIHRRLGWKFWAFVCGGAALSGETEEFFKRIGYAVVQGYGMTETASLISLNHPFRAAQGSIGKVLPGREFRLAEDGEILVRGENVAGGYWEGGALRAGMRDGGEWLRTGDIGEMDAEGNLRFRGRKKSVIVTVAGLNVFPEDLEGMLRRQSGVRDCVVVAMEHGGNAEACAVMLMDAGVATGAQECCAPTGETMDAAARRVVDAANGSLAEYQRMRSWVVWPELDFPRTATGKPRLAVIAERARSLLNGTAEGRRGNLAPSLRGEAWSGASGAGPGMGASGTTVQSLLSEIGERGNAAEHLERGLNLSSLDRVELLSALEEKFHVELNETAFSSAKTVADVERLLHQPAAQRTEYVYPRWTQREPARWFRLAVYYALVWPATQILGHPRVVGREHLRNLRGPVLVVSNHVAGRADIGLILAALPARYRHKLATAMAAETLEELRHAPKDWFFAKRWSYHLGYWLVTLLFNVFPLPKLSGVRESFRFAGESVDRGYSVLIFPEGVINNSETGELAKFQSGAGLLAENLGIAIVPMRLDGVWGMKRERRRLAHFGEILVRIGAPVTFPAGTPADEIALSLESIVRRL